MAYLVLARKYRPDNFDQVVGQRHITDILKNAILSDRVGQAYLFCGPRGIGKTTCARIFAKALNCDTGVTATPCGQCSACVSITQGNSFDVLEIDGASNRGIDEIRTIRENVKFAPGYGRYKIYIVDEVHMLTTEAFNALLKTLEEPPEHVKFIFATTDPNKLPSTIISRCQRFDFKRIAFKELCESLKDIAEREGIRVSQDAIYAMVKASGGSFRDALSILDQVGSLTEKQVDGHDVYEMLGLVEWNMIFQLTAALGRGDCAQALVIFDSIIDRGKDVKQLGKDLIEHFRNLMVIKLAGSSVDKIREMGRLIDYPGEIKDLLLQQSQTWTLREILAAVDIFIEAQDTARVTEFERLPMEIAFAKLALALHRTPVDGEPECAEKTSRGGREPTSSDSVPSSRDQGYSPASMIRNKKGQVNASGNTAESDHDDEEIEPMGDAAVPVGMHAPSCPETIDLEFIRTAWPAMTHAVSRERMSLATYLQEAVPSVWDGDRLEVAFLPENAFFKECLEGGDNTRTVERIFTHYLKQPVMVKYTLSDQAAVVIGEKDISVVKDVLDTFGGEIVNRWHNA